MLLLLELSCTLVNSIVFLQALRETYCGRSVPLAAPYYPNKQREGFNFGPVGKIKIANNRFGELHTN